MRSKLQKNPENMYEGNRLFTIICARGGSKGMPNKNIAPMLGKPLIAYTIEQAKILPFLDRLVVSTENAEIAKIAVQYGAEVPFLRPAKLATDNYPVEPAIIYTLKQIEALHHETYDIIMLLDPTNPMRTSADIQNALDLLLSDRGIESVISAVQAIENPYYDVFELNTSGFAHRSKQSIKRLIRRQDAPPVYAANASISVARRYPFLKAKSFLLKNLKLSLMPPEASFDIDRPLDLKIVEFLMTRRLRGTK